MRAGLRAALVNNWPIKLTSLALAAVLWAAVAAEEPTTQLVPVTLLVEPPEGRALTRPLPQVKALYTGSARELIKLYGTPPVITAMIPDTLTGSSYSLELSPGELKLAQKANVQAQDVQPRRIEVTLDAVSHRTVPVVSRVAVKPDTGFAVVGGLALSPSSLLVRGPDAVVARIESVTTVPLEITAVRGPVRRNVPIDTEGLGVAQVSRREVEVSAEIEAVSERALLDVPVAVRGDRGAWMVDPPTVLVTLRGPAARVARLNKDSVAVVAQPTAGGRRETVRLGLLTPPGIEATARPDTVRIQRRGDG
jgi:YbbR domain-containing protein